MTAQNRRWTGMWVLVALVVLVGASVLLASCGSTTSTSTLGPGSSASSETTGVSGSTASSETSGAGTTTGPSTSTGGAGSAAGGGSGEGATIFASDCATCHGQQGEGQTGPDLRPLTENDKDRIEAQVTNGGGGMPSFGDKLSKEQIDSVSEYVAGLQ